MNRVIGKILLEKTGVGIPNLLVTVYDVDRNTVPEEAIELSRVAAFTNFWNQLQGDRLGSVLTDENGTFELEYEENEFRTRNDGKRPDLVLFVTAPETQGAETCSPILHVSCGIRQNAGRIETYVIQLKTEQLEKVGVRLPLMPTTEAEEPEKIIAKLVNAEDRRLRIEAGIREGIQKKRVEKLRARSVTFAERHRPDLIRTLSHVPEELRQSETFVAEGESAKAKTFATIKKGLKVVSNDPDSPVKRAPIRGFISLSPEQVEALEKLSNESGIVPADKLYSVVGEGESAGAESISHGSDLLRDDPVAKFCLETTVDGICPEEETADARGNGEASGDDVSSGETEALEVAGNGVSVADKEDVPKYVATVMSALSPPEDMPELRARATQDDIQKNIAAFSLGRSPADATAFHDFHNLQIAFEHVWQEAIDQGVLDLAEDAYQKIVELGGDPETMARARGNPIGGLQAEANYLLSAVSQPSGTTGIMYGPAPSQNGGGRRSDGGEFDCGAQIAQREKRIRELEEALKACQEQTPSDAPDYIKLSRLLEELERRLREETFNFTYYAADKKERSINFGILVTYRQKWEPQNYQVGELVKTIPLAPKEVRKFSKKTVIKKKRSEKEVEKNLISRKEEVSETSRAEEEIIRKVHANTNFNLTAQGSYNVGISEGTQTTTLNKDAGRTSDEIKKDFREAIFKSAQEYKQERSIDITTEEVFEEEFTESGEIMNPNDEIACTFLFYELQRRYKVTERIHRLRHVVLVAQEMPNPADIDEDWLIEYDWILNRVLLDDSFRPALTYVSSRLVGDSFAVQELRKNVVQQRRIVDEIKDEVIALDKQSARLYYALRQAIEKEATIVGEREGIVERFGEAIVTQGISEVGKMFGFGGDGDDEKKREAARIRREAAEEAYERAAMEERELRSRLDREVTAIEAATERYTKALREHLNQKTQVARLRIHMKQNILHYMQAIWAHEPPDQRFFRLHKVQVPIFEEKSKTFKIARRANLPSFATLPHLGAAPYEVLVDSFIDPRKPQQPEADFETASLVEVADLDNLLGFKGNYMIFPLKKPNPVTEFMAEPYIDRATEQLIDPDPLGNINLDDFEKYVCCLKKRVSKERFEELKAQLEEILRSLLHSPLRNREDLIVPTGSLYIEALPAKHPILENFKLMHRALDVKKVQAEVRDMELENIRAAARLLFGEREDPDIDSKYVFEGGGNATIVPPGGSGGGGGSQ